MANADDVRNLSMAMDGTVEAPHFDWTAYKVRRIYVTIPPDRQTANFMLTPDEQQLKCLLLPDALFPVRNKWGDRGATTARLDALSLAELQSLIDLAYAHAVSKKPTR